MLSIRFRQDQHTDSYQHANSPIVIGQTNDLDPKRKQCSISVEETEDFHRCFEVTTTFGTSLFDDQ